MDNPLTPKKIQRLMYLAEDKSFNAPGYSLQYGRATNSARTQSTISPSIPDQSAVQSQSSGVLDLDHCEGFGDSELGNLSLSKSSTFNPGEITGRSTDAEDVGKLAPPPTFAEFGRFSVNSIKSLAKKLNQQSSDVKELMRQSIASTYSFHSRRDLSADEASLVMREAPLPVAPSQINLKDSMVILDHERSDRSVGAYFGTRCAEFSQMLPRNDSPSYDVSNLAISVLDESLQVPEGASSTRNHYKFDGTLDSVPVRQPRPAMNLTTNIGYTPASPVPTTTTTKTMMLPPKSKGLVKTNQTSIMLDPTKQHLLAPQRTEDSSGDYDSLSISNIAVLLGKESNVSVTDMLKHMKSQKPDKKHPLTEVDMNSENYRILNCTKVTTLAESKKSETASSAGTINTVIDISKLKINQENLPMTSFSVTHSYEKSGSKSPSNKSKSPSAKSTSTFSTVREASTTIQSGDSPLHNSKGSAAHASPSVQYRELDQSVDWRDVLRGGHRENWAEVTTKPAEGFVGVNVPAVVTIQSQSDSWLTARFEFDLQTIGVGSKDLTIDLPRFPILLTPGKTEEITAQITSNIELDTNIPYTLYLKDSTIDCDIEIKGDIAVKFRMPTLQAVSSGGMNKVVFQPIEEGKSLKKTVVLISDCSADLQLDLSVAGTMFTINSVQEIKKSDVTKKLLDCPQEEKGKKIKGSAKQLCRLSSGNAIRVSITFTSPKLTEMAEKTTSINGSLNVNLIGTNALLKKVDLLALVGFAKLTCQLPSYKLQLNNEESTIPLTNEGTVRGAWAVRFKDFGSEHPMFKLSCASLEVDAGCTVPLKAAFIGSEARLVESTLLIEDSTGKPHVMLYLSGGQNKPKVFPIKTNCSSLSWVRPGRKEISLKNSTDKRIHLKCRIVGDGFKIDLPRFSGQTVLLTFGPCECRGLPVVFSAAAAPRAATLHLASEGDNDTSRKVTLYGCGGGMAARWRGLATYGDTALVRAVARQPLELKLVSRDDAPIFISASVHFNLQYMCVSATARLSNARRVVTARGLATLTLHLDWGQIERKARDAAASTALATVTVLTGAEFTRRRILKVLREEAGGSLDVTTLPEHLRRLAGSFDGEDPAMDEALKDFHETRASLEELVSGLRELTAQVDLPPELQDDNTILLTDDTVLDHHTLID